VVRLGQTSVSEGVLVDFIGTIKEPFSLSADQIIYLTDLGIPGPAIQALLKRSALFVDAPAPEPQIAAAPQPVPAPAPASTNATPPVVGPVQTIAQPPAPAQAQATTVIQAPTTEVTVNTFYDSLSAYGSWVEVPEYGWCWQPSVAAVNINWQPYADNGAWLWTDSGWYWNSYYSWGWAPFHYGRWHRARFGWCWVPDTYWAPAWVTWRSSDSYCGWAPLPPSARRHQLRYDIFAQRFERLRVSEEKRFMRHHRLDDGRYDALLRPHAQFAHQVDHAVQAQALRHRGEPAGDKIELIAGELHAAAFLQQLLQRQKVFTADHDWPLMHSAR
jgi:hypothetical protein